MTQHDSDALLSAALGGRVAHTDFCAPAESSGLVAKLRRTKAAIGVVAHGGFPGAQRRRVTVFPGHIPEAAPTFCGVYLPGLTEAIAQQWLAGQGIAPGHMGDLIAHPDGTTVITAEPPPQALLAPLPDGQAPLVVPVERVVGGDRRESTIIVPSLRVDALGAKAFKVSRSYFAKGVAGGKVYLNGTRAAKGTSAAAGDEVYAEGLGWLELKQVAGETRRGNLKVEVAVSRRR